MKIHSFLASLLITTAICLSILGCNKDDLDCMPSCLAEEIEWITKFNCEGEAGIVEYSFQNRIVYYINPGNCFDDQANEVVNSRCETIGTLGGIVGNEIINGIDFFDNAIKLSVVWQR